jgi:hypothetical protein
MGLSTEEWAEQNGFSGLWDELDIHAKNADPEDFARLAMISFRQWVETKNEQPRRG